MTCGSHPISAITDETTPSILARALVLAAGQRWFPTNWPDQNWAESALLPLTASTASDDQSRASITEPTLAILLARPETTGPWLQMPIEIAPDGTVTDATENTEFWRRWLQLSELTEAELPGQLQSANALGKEQSNSSIELVFDEGDRWVAKVFRVVHPGDNPDVELPLALHKLGFEEAAPVRSYLNLPLPSGGTYCSGVATTLVDNDGTAYDYYLALAAANEDPEPSAHALGRLLGRMDRAFGKVPLDEDRTVDWDSLRAEVLENLDTTAKMAEFSELTVQRLREVILDLTTSADAPKFSRVHGDLHLGQILHGPDDTWTVIDFEGEPLRSLAERRRPDFRLRDLAGMLRSFHYAAPDNPQWAERARIAFLDGFSSETTFDAQTDGQILQLLEVDKALYETRYEVQFRPDWLHIPLRTIASLSE